MRSDAASNGERGQRQDGGRDVLILPYLCAKSLSIVYPCLREAGDLCQAQGAMGVSSEVFRLLGQACRRCVRDAKEGAAAAANKSCGELLIFAG